MKYAPLRAVTTINPRVPKDLATQTDRIVHFVPMSEVSDQGFVSPNGTRRINEVIKGYTYFENGDVLIAKITPCMENGKAALIEGLEHDVAFGSTEFHVLRPNQEVDGKYLFYMIWNPVFRHQAEIQMTGSAGQKRVPKSFLERFEIPLPKLEEQKRIAAILDKADAIRRKRQEAMDEANKLLESAFIDFFGDPVNNPHGWDKLPLPRMATRITVGIVVKPASYYVADGVPALRSLNVRENRIEQRNFVYFSPKDNETTLAKTRVWEGDVVLVRSGQPGTAAVIPKELNGVNAIDVLIVTPKSKLVSSTYLACFFNSQAGKRIVVGQERGQIQKHLNVGSLKDVEIPMPPITEQNRFDKVARKIVALEEHLSRSYFESNDLFNSLVQRAFKGEL